MNKSHPNYFHHTRRIAIELSSMCPFAPRHPKCAASRLQQAKQILPATIVHDVLSYLGDVNYSRTIAWHCLNDPLCDPRLSEFLKAARQKCPEAKLLIWTNGWYLNTALAKELLDAGAHKIRISCYWSEDLARFQQIRKQVGRQIRVLHNQSAKMDDRLTRPPDGRSTNRISCYAPLRAFTIRASGHIGLCPLDWQTRVAFGDLHQMSFADVLKAHYPALLQLHRDLLRGVRKLPVCQECAARMCKVW